MTDVALRLKDELLQLSDDDRMELMAALHDSLADHLEADELVWEAELARRFEEFQSGERTGRPAAEMFAELRKRYS